MGRLLFVFIFVTLINVYLAAPKAKKAPTIDAIDAPANETSVASPPIDNSTSPAEEGQQGRIFGLEKFGIYIPFLDKKPTTKKPKKKKKKEDSEETEDSSEKPASKKKKEAAEEPEKSKKKKGATEEPEKSKKKKGSTEEPEKSKKKKGATEEPEKSAPKKTKGGSGDTKTEQTPVLNVDALIPVPNQEVSLSTTTSKPSKKKKS